MNKFHSLTLALLTCVPLLACSQSPAPPAPPAPPAASNDAPTTILGRHVAKALNEARAELRKKNISISDGFDINVNGHHVHRAEGLPNAEITPQGDLLVEGKPVAINASQRAQLIEYRGHIIAIAEAGMDIGAKGADLASKAVGEAIGAIFSGDKDGVEKRMEAEGLKIKASAMKLCAQLPPLLTSQQSLAASLPAFKPYATLTQEDINDCGKDDKPNVAVTTADNDQMRDEIRQKIRENIRGSIQAATPEVKDAEASTTR